MLTESATPNDKQLVISVVMQMPESASLAEISERIAIMAGIREGKADIAAGRFLSHEEVVERSAQWITK